jgi:lipid-binding SYLF domain-containing protein
MKRTAIALLGVVLGIMISGPVWAEEDADRETKARETVAMFKKTDPTLKTFFNESAGYAVFPTVGKGGIIIGGAYGKGVVFAGGSAIGKTSLTQATIGAQLGGQAYSEIIFFEDQNTLDNFKEGNFAFSAQATAVALKSGAGANADNKDGVAVFTAGEAGLMFEASIGGQKFSFEPK